jgi:uncharacterized protein (DUF362 family)
MKYPRRLSRRDFIKILVSTSAALTLAACIPQKQEIFPTLTTGLPTQSPSPTDEATHAATDKPMDNNNPPAETTSEATPSPAYLGVARGSDPAAITTAALAALGGIERFVKSGANVILKPNICTNYYSYEYGATTNPDVVATLVRLCFGAGAGRVRVMDSPFGGSAESAYEKSGIAAAVGAAGGEREGMNPPKFLINSIPKGLDIQEWSLYQDALDADVLINIPIAKSHSLTRLTLGCKNLMGLIENRGGIHSNIHQRIADLVSIFQPELTIIDATRILVANGPTGGNLDDVRITNTIIASPDIVAADAYAATLFGLQGSDIGYIQTVANMGLGELDLGKLNIEEINF